jgi:penicillin-binding protein 2
MLERQDQLRGVDVERVFLRKYPYGKTGAHLFGTVGEVTREQLDDERYNGVEQGDRIGQSGIEAEYDRFLRGRNGAARVEVDALGNLTETLRRREPEQGRQLRLAVDLDVQKTGQRALAGGTGRGAFAVMNVRNGEVIALASEPSFDPNIFTKPVSQRTLDRLSAEEFGKPLYNRAIQGGYPTGSTFKLVTATAALEAGVLTPEEIVNDPGSLVIGTQEFKNAGGAVHGAIALRQALTVSSDVFFYKLGLELNSHGDGLALQRWSRKLGVGHNTGIDLPNELPGRIPTPAWRNRGYRQFIRCQDRRKPSPAEIAQGVCGFFDRPWSPGDNINLSVGQGDIAANPLQMAVAYAAIANGGRVLRPRLGLRIEDASGRALQQLDAPTARRLDIDPAHRQAIIDGLRGAASAPGGTSTPVFQDFPIPIAGKTGTAEKGALRPDQSWYVALAPYPDFKYVVAVTDEAGGFGADTAAPMARLILADLFGVNENQLVQGGAAPD